MLSTSRSSEMIDSLTGVWVLVILGVYDGSTVRVVVEVPVIRGVAEARVGIKDGSGVLTDEIKFG